jgi:hypothetical protein
MLPPEFAPLLTIVAEIIVLGVFLIVTLGILGYFLNERFGALLLATLPLMALWICPAFYAAFALAGLSIQPPADLELGEVGRLEWSVATARNWGAVGLVLAIIIVAGTGALVGSKFGGSESGKRRGAILIPGLWLGFCFAGWIGHQAGSWVGLLTITLPAVAIFWLALYALAHYILPLDKDQPALEAFRCLLTFSAGTNYPYCTVEDRKGIEVVPGNRFSQFFAGPGIFLTGPDYAAAASDGLQFRGVRGPGVAFTRLFESAELVDLRPQQRAFTVEATTKDGIPLKFTAFGPFQLDTGEQQPELGKPFPFRSSSIFKALHARPIDINRDTVEREVVEERKQRRWDELYEMIGTHIMQDIVAEYNFDQLYEPSDPNADPRRDIAEKYRQRMRQELPKYGIKIPGGGLSNLLPADEDAVSQQRIKNWQARWRRRMLEELGAAEADAERLIGQTRAEVQAEMIQNISDAIAEVATDDQDTIINMVALRFIESLNRMVSQSAVREGLTPEVTQVVEELRIIGAE